MAANEVIGWEAIKRQYDLYKDCPYFALCDARKNSDQPGNIIFTYKGGDKPEGWEMLKENLQAGEQNAPDAPYILLFYEELSKSGKLDKSLAAAGYFRLRLQAYEGYKPAIGAVSTLPAGRDFNEYLRFELDGAKALIRELQGEKEDLKDQVADLEDQLAGGTKEIGGVIGQIGEAGNQFPWLADIIKEGITFFKHKYGGGHAQAAHGGINGVGNPQDMPAAQNMLLTWYTKEYGGGGSDEPARKAGADMFIKDMCLLAGLTKDDDMMRLALKKLRALE